jgi:glutathione peroxidase
MRMTLGALVAIGIGIGVAVAGGAQAQAQAGAQAPNAHAFNMTRIDGKPMPFRQYRGKVMLVVNTASMCGFTQQYEGLQKLQNRYAKAGFTVVGVPSANFANQEYDSNAKIKEFCEAKFGINFPMTERANVKGPQAAPFYRWAAATLPENNVPQWNFHKFLVGRDGRLIAGFGSKVAPESPQMTAAIEAALRAGGRG